MQKLIIKNFGPIKDIELEIKDFMVFIGPQASGKSTISKVIYFFQSLPDIFNYFINNYEYTHDEIFGVEPYNFDVSTIQKRIIKHFVDIWTANLYTNRFQILYIRNESIIEIYNDGNHKIPKIKVNKSFEEVFNQIKSISLDNNATGMMNRVKKSILINRKLNEIINTNYSISRYIPAGRSALATLSEVHQTDYIRNEENSLMQNFIRFIASEKRKFGQGLDLVIDRQLALEPDKVDKSTLKLAKKLITKILKGEYKNGNGDKIMLENDKYVFLNEASSGQQEAIWILYLLFAEILKQRKTIITIEEPEAHLYPEAQKDIIDMIALLFNTAKNQVILTTHSPYILASINNLLYANKVGENNEEKVSQIIDKKLWLDYNRFEAFFVSNGVITNIMDEEFQMIKNEAIDSASRIINQQFDDLYEFDS